jgi:hypothetical protein
MAPCTGLPGPCNCFMNRAPCMPCAGFNHRTPVCPGFTTSVPTCPVLVTCTCHLLVFCTVLPACPLLASNTRPPVCLSGFRACPVLASCPSFLLDLCWRHALGFLRAINSFIRGGFLHACKRYLACRGGWSIHCGFCTQSLGPACNYNHFNAYFKA